MAKITALFCLLFISQTIYAGELNQVPMAIRAQIETQWGAHNESALLKSFLFVPRLIGHPIAMLVLGKTVQRVVNVGDASVHLIKGIGSADQLETAGYKEGDSVLNPGATLVDATSDIVSLLKSPRYATSRFSQRIKICTSNLESGITSHLTGYHSIMPAQHVAFMVDDGVWETNDPESGNTLHDALDKGGIICVSAPVLKNESDSLAIERLKCVDSEYRRRFDYSFWRNNCGTYSSEIAKISGLGFPILPNMGFGIVNATRGSDKSRDQQQIRAICDAHVASLRQLLVDLEEGRSLDKQRSEFLISLNSRTAADDTVLQLWISAARGKNTENRAMLASMNPQINVRTYLLDEPTTDIKFKFSLASELSKMFVGMDDEDFNWLQANGSTAYNLYLAAQEQLRVERNSQN